MTTGSAIGIGAAVVGAGAVGYFVIRKRPPTTVTGAPLPPLATLPPVAPTKPAPVPPITAAVKALETISIVAPVSSSISAFQAVNNAACGAVVGSKGVPKGLAALGCSTYTKYLSPIGLAQTTIGLVEKVPVIGGPVKATVKAVTGVANKIVSLPLSLAAHPAEIGHAVAKVAGVPVAVAAKGAKLVGAAVLGAAKSPVKAITTVALAPAKLAVKSVTLPAHMAVAGAKTAVKAVGSAVKALKFW